jgi:hypothetical protein
MTVRFLTALLVIWTAAVVTSAQAPRIQLSIHDGRVWLDATNATPRQILVEWARVGRTRVDNEQRIPGGPLTLQLDGVPEQQALDVLLRSAGGFMAASRAVAVADASRFDRIIIVPFRATAKDDVTRSAGGQAAEPLSQTSPYPQTALETVASPGVQRVVGPDGLPVPDDQEDTPGGPPTRPTFTSIPPGFSAPPDAPPPALGAPTSAPTTTPRPPVGVAVPGTIVPPRAPAGQTRPPRS